MFKTSGNSRNSGLIIYSQLVLDSPVVTVKRMRFYSSTVRAARDVNARLPRRLTSLDHVWVIAVVLLPWRRVSYFGARGCYRKKSKPERARGVVERKQTKRSHLLLQSGHHVHDDNWQFNGAKAFLGTANGAFVNDHSLFGFGLQRVNNVSTAVDALNVTTFSPSEYILFMHQKPSVERFTSAMCPL